jgi:hypothetical protein
MAWAANEIEFSLKHSIVSINPHKQSNQRNPCQNCWNRRRRCQPNKLIDEQNSS